MYVTIRRYESIDQSRKSELVKKVDETLLPTLSELPGVLDGLLADRPDADWARPTPAPGWTVAQQIAHLTWTDRAALLAATDHGAFHASVAAAVADPTGFIDAGDVPAPAARAQPAAILERVQARPAVERLPGSIAQMVRGAALASGKVDRRPIRMGQGGPLALLFPAA